MMNSTPLTPSPHHDHVYAIVRCDRFHAADVAFEQLITIKKVVRDPEFAAAEVRRLNELNGPKDSIYFMQVTRLERETAMVPQPCPIDDAASMASASEERHVEPQPI